MEKAQSFPIKVIQYYNFRDFTYSSLVMYANYLHCECVPKDEIMNFSYFFSAIFSKCYC